jgi:hypothetical protein
MATMRTYQWNGHSIKVQLRPYGVFLWLAYGIEVWVDGRKFVPQFDHIALTTSTDFEIELQDGSRVHGVAKSLAIMWFLPRVKCSIAVGDTPIACEIFTLHKWYLAYIGWLIAFLLFLLMGLGVLFVIHIVPLMISR